VLEAAKESVEGIEEEGCSAKSSMGESWNIFKICFSFVM
jgi:hypothetical protein